MLARIRCFVFGHKFTETGRFKGGACFCCSECGTRHTSFGACPSYRSDDDAPLTRGQRPIWKR